MVIAARTNTTLAATITQAGLVAAIITAMGNAGFGNPVGNYLNSTTRVLVYEHIIEELRQYGKIVLTISISSTLAITTNIASSYNAVNNTFTNSGTATVFTAFSTATAINFTSFNAGTEFKLVVVTQGSIVVPIGVLVPTFRPSWWNLDLWNFGFYPQGNNFTTWSATARNPYNNTLLTALTINSPVLASPNPQTGQRDILTGCLIASNSNTGVAGKTSDDICVGCFAGTTRFDTIQPQGTIQVFTILSNIAGGLAVRTQ